MAQQRLNDRPLRRMALFAVSEPTMTASSVVQNAILYLDFTRASSADVLRGGWGVPQSNGAASIATESVIDLGPVAVADYLLEIELWPFFQDCRDYQTVQVHAGDALLGESRVSRWSTLGYEIAAGMIPVEGPLMLRFLHPDAARPCDIMAPSTDRRLLSMSVVSLRLTPSRIGALTSPARPSLDPPPPFAPSRFESLGDNCEFGLVQRALGHEHIGLFKFSGVPLRELLSALRTGLDGIERITPDMIVLERREAEDEYMVMGGPFHFQYHTNVFRRRSIPVQTGEIDALIPIFQKKLLFEKRKLLVDLKEGQKIFVFRSHEFDHLEYILPLWHALNQYGPNKLLWVGLAGDPSRAGTAREIRPGLMHGVIDRFAPMGHPADLSLDIWLRICGEAAGLLSDARPR